MKIYLATPYNDPSPEVRQQRFEDINRVAAKIINDYGFLVFSPISHSHPIAEVGNLPKGFDFWKQYDKSFIEWADEVWVYATERKKSKGVAYEIALAKKLGKRVCHLKEGWA